MAQYCVVARLGRNRRKIRQKRNAPVYWRPDPYSFLGWSKWSKKIYYWNLRRQYADVVFRPSGRCRYAQPASRRQYSSLCTHECCSARRQWRSAVLKRTKFIEVLLQGKVFPWGRYRRSDVKSRESAQKSFWTSSKNLKFVDTNFADAWCLTNNINFGNWTYLCRRGQHDRPV